MRKNVSPKTLFFLGNFMTIKVGKFVNFIGRSSPKEKLRTEFSTSFLEDVLKKWVSTRNTRKSTRKDVDKSDLNFSYGLRLQGSSRHVSAICPNPIRFSKGFLQSEVLGEVSVLEGGSSGRSFSQSFRPCFAGTCRAKKNFSKNFSPKFPWPSTAKLEKFQAKTS